MAKYYAEKLGEPVKPEDQHAGLVYEVAINLSLDTLINWDASLPKQSDYVRQALGDHVWRDEPMLNGERFYDALPVAVPRVLKIIAYNEYQKNQGDLAALEAALAARVAAATPEVKAGAAAIMHCLRTSNITTGRVIKPGNGSHLLDDFNRLHATPKMASRALRALGIKGIRYLDEGSREMVGHQTSNFVIFNARNVRIVKVIKPIERRTGPGHSL